MPAILTKKYRSFLCEQFYNQLASNTMTAYVFIGRVSQWEDAANVAISDTNPPTPVDTVQNSDFAYWRDLIGVKRVSYANTQFVVPRADWVSGTVYDQYDDTDPALPTKHYFVLDTTDTPYKVYKCLWNNNGGISNVAPSVVGTALNPTTTADSYVWQYMYTVDTGNYKFLTDRWMPVLSDATIQNNAFTNSGKLPTAVPLVINDPGLGYNASVSSATSIVGDGSGAAVSSNGVTITGGVVSKVSLATGGLGYSEVTSINVYQAGASSLANVRCIIPPYPNHGYNPIKELNAVALMLTAEFDETEGEALTVDNDYRRFGLLINPLTANSVLANAAFYRQTLDITLSANTGVFRPDDVIVNQTKNAAPFATVVDVVQPVVNGSYVVRTTMVEDEGEANPFEFNDVFKCLETGAEGTVGAVSAPELTEFSGSIIYVNQRTPVARGANQNEEIKIVLPLG